MLVPTRRPKDFINGLMLDPFETFLDSATALAKPAPTLMKTDIKETDAAYELTIDLPGFKKDDVAAELKNGYLTVSASTESSKEVHPQRALQRQMQPQLLCWRRHFRG